MSVACAMFDLNFQTQIYNVVNRVARERDHTTLT